MTENTQTETDTEPEDVPPEKMNRADYMSGEYGHDKRVNFTANQAVYDRVQESTEHGAVSREMRAKLWEMMVGDARNEREKVKAKLEEKQERKQEVDAKIRELRAESENLETEIRELRHKYDTMESAEDKAKTKLEDIEANLWDGQNITTKLTTVKEAAHLLEVTPDEVVERVRERNPEAPDYAFEPPMSSRQTWDMSTARLHAPPGMFGDDE